MSYEVWGEPEDLPECSACADAAEDYAQLEKVVGNLTTLVKRLAGCLKLAIPGHELPDQAMAYLKDNHLAGTQMRETSSN